MDILQFYNKNQCPATWWRNSPLQLAGCPVNLQQRVQWQRSAGDTNWQPPCCVSGGSERRPVVNTRWRYRPLGSSQETDRSWRLWAVRLQPGPEPEPEDWEPGKQAAESTGDREVSLPPRQQQQQPRLPQPPVWAPLPCQPPLPPLCPRSRWLYPGRVPSSPRCSSARYASTTSCRPSCSARRVIWSATRAARS